MDKREELLGRVFVLDKKMKVVASEYLKVKSELMGLMKNGEELKTKKGGAKYIEYSQYSISPTKFSKKIPLKRFVSCVTVNVTKARKWMGENDISKISSKRLCKRLILKERKCVGKAKNR